jgi:hypothetical protein
MQRKHHFIGIIAVGAFLSLTAAIWLAFAPPAKAQCGSQASSCKNCHEVQGELSVNSDGTGWHESHAFGDFCYICHAGNQQATDKDEAHAGMVPPLSDVKASCMQCHPSDLDERAQVYATTLGIDLSAGGGAETSSGETTGAPAAAAETSGGTSAAANVPLTTELDVNDPNLVDYVKNYDEIVLGKTPTNWGNVILTLLIVLGVVGGGGFILRNENLVRVNFGDMKKPDDEYPADVVEMLPPLSNLKPESRRSLKKLLGNRKKTETVLEAIDTVMSNEEE